MLPFKISKVGTRYVPKQSTHKVPARNPLSFSTPESGVNGAGHLVNGPLIGCGTAADGGKLGKDSVSSSPTLPKISETSSLLGKRTGSYLLEGTLQPIFKKKRVEVKLAKGDGERSGCNPFPISLEDQTLCGEASFAVNLFSDGFSVNKATEKMKTAPLGYEVMETLYPYDRTSESFLRAIDGGWLPGDLLDDIPCTYVNGCVICELRDYRYSMPSNSRDMVSSPRKGVVKEWVPDVHKILLQPSTETIVKDIASLAAETWTYRDILEVEARILKAIQPSLCLDPTPAVARKAYTANFNKLKFNVGFRVLRRYRMPKEAVVDRHHRLTASAKVLSKIGNLSKLRKINLDSDKSVCGSYGDYQTMQDSTVASLMLSSGALAKQGISSQPQLVMPVQSSTSQGSSGQAFMNRVGQPPIPVGISIPSVQIPSSPSSSTPATPATPSTVTSANESGGFAGDMKLGSVSSLLGKRDGKEFATATRAEVKKLKLEQAKVDKYHQQLQKVQQKQEAKQLKEIQRKEKIQHQYQLKQQRSTDSTSQKQISQMVSYAQQSSQETVSHSDLKASCQVDQDQLDIKPTELEVSKPVQEMGEQKHESEQLRSDWDKTDADIKKEPVPQESLLQSDQLDEQQLKTHVRPMHSRQFGKAILGSGQSPQWPQLGQAVDMKLCLKAEKDVKQDEMFTQQKKKMASNMKVPQKSVQMQLPAVINSAPSPMSSAGLALGVVGGINLGSVGASISSGLLQVPMISSPSISAPKSPVQGMATGFSSPGAPGQISASSTQGLRRRSNSLPKIQAVPSPNSLSSSIPSPMLNSPSTVSGALSSPSVKGEQGLTVQLGPTVQPGLAPIASHGQRKPSVDTTGALLEVIHRFDLNSRKKLNEELPPPNKNPPSFQLLAVALSNNNSDDNKEVKGRRSMANSLVGGNINARKTRFLQFVRADHVQQGPGYPPQLVRSRTRLVFCGRGKDTMVEAVVQMGDDQDDDSQQSTPPHHVLPTMANPEKADQFATQYATLMEKEGWELIEDQIQAAMPQGASAMTNAASNARPMPAGASTLGNNMGHPVSSPRMLSNQQHGLPSGMSPLSQMQPPSPNALAAARMPPPTNSARPMMSNHLGQSVPGKPMQMDLPSSQIATVQHQQQQHQLQHQQQQHQLQHLHQHQLLQQQGQRPQQLAAAQQLVAQLAAQNPGQQMSSMHASQSLNYFQHPQNHRQPGLFQRKMLPSGLSNLGMNMNGGSNMSGINGVGLSVSGGGAQVGLANVVGLSGMNGVTGMGGMTGMTNSMVGMSGLSNIGQLSGTTNMGQAGAVPNMMGQQLRSGTINQVQAQAAAALASKRLASGRGRTPGTSSSPVRSTIDSLPMVSTNQIHSTPGVPMMGQSMARSGLTPIQRTPITGMALPKVGNPVIGAGVTGQGYYINQQQLSSQQMGSGGLGSLVGGPPSPQMGTQGLGPVTGLSSSSLDLQNASRGGTLTAVASTGRSQVRRPMMPPQAQTGQPGQPSQ